MCLNKFYLFLFSLFLINPAICVDSALPSPSIRFIENLSILKKGDLGALATQVGQDFTSAIKKDANCYAEGSLKPGVNCAKFAVLTRKGDQPYVTAKVYDKIYVNSWSPHKIIEKQDDSLSYFGDNYIDRQKMKGSISEQLDTGTFQLLQKDVDVISGSDSQTSQTLATKGVGALSHVVESLCHSETAFMTAILRQQEDPLEQGQDTPDVTILFVTSTLPACKNCVPRLERLFTDQESRAAIIGRKNSNFHIIYQYLEDSETDNPFTKDDTAVVKTDVDFKGENPLFLGTPGSQ